MNLREEIAIPIREYREEEKEHLDLGKTVDGIISIIEKRIDECKTIEEFKELLK